MLLLLLLTDGCSSKRRRKPSKPRAAAVTAAAAVTTCAQCLAIQETIGRAIAQNISGIRRRAVHATLPIHDIVQGLCDTEAWAAERYQPELEQACVRATRPGWFELFEHWSAPGLAARRPGDKNVNEVYVHDPALTLRVKASACGQAARRSLTLTLTPTLTPTLTLTLTLTLILTLSLPLARPARRATSSGCRAWRPPTSARSAAHW